MQKLKQAFKNYCKDLEDFNTEMSNKMIAWVHKYPNNERQIIFRAYIVAFSPLIIAALIVQVGFTIGGIIVRL